MLPSESKVGTVEIETPVLTEKALGSVYVAKPFDNPYDNLLTLYVVAKIPDRGIIVKTAGKVEANPVSGQLTTTFDNIPQLPFNKFTLKFNQGADLAALKSRPPAAPTPAKRTSRPTPNPNNPRHTLNSFEMTEGVHNGPCPSGGIPPFHPDLIAGSINNAAGTYSPFYVRLIREDGEQEITHFSIKLPPGVVGKLAGIPLCSEAADRPGQIARTRGRRRRRGSRSLLPGGLRSRPHLRRSRGRHRPRPHARQALPRRPLPRLGDLGRLDHQRQGRPLRPRHRRRSARRSGSTPKPAKSSSTPTGSDPIPHIVDGIPTRLRDIRIYMDRPEFVLNPTCCEPTSTASTLLGSGASFTQRNRHRPGHRLHPLPGRGLRRAAAFGPDLALSLTGSTKRGGDPAFKATLTAHPGEANTGHAQVTLPRSEFLEQAHIGTVCTRVQFAEGAVPGEHCPANSIYGFAKAVTPILSEPLEGPVYLRSNGGERKLPDLVAALHSGEINIDLVGYVEGVHGGIRNTFETLPDAPVSTFTLEMEGGNKGLLVNSTNLCAGTHRATAHFEGHNGKIEYFKPPLAPASCHKKAKRHRKHLATRRHRKSGGR